jgi:membrane protein
MLIIIKNTLTVFKKAFKKWISRDPIKESSVIAYNAIFSLPGLLVVVITIASYFFGSELINQELHNTISKAMGPDTADQVREMIIIALKSRDSIWATILGIATIFLGATGVFVQMQKSLNIIWEVKATTKKSGVWTFVKTRLFSFGLIISIAFLLLISMVVTTLLAAVGSWVKVHWTESMIWLFNILNFVLSIGIIMLLFAMMYKILPDAKIKWNIVWRGAFVTALLFVIGKTLLGLYFGRATPGSGYGAAGSIVLILLWTSYSAMIVFYGAEVTKAYADKYVGNVPPTEVAVKEKGREA